MKAPKLSTVPLSELEAELSRRQRSHDHLLRRHSTLLSKLDALEEEMIQIGLRPPPRGSGGLNGSRSGSLADNLWELMGDDETEWEIGALADEAIRAKLPQSSRVNFRRNVMYTLCRRDDLFERVARATYRRISDE